MNDGSIYLVMVGTFFGFTALAFILLFPVWRFIRRQEQIADDWTDDSVARRASSRPQPQTDLEDEETTA